MFVLLAFYFYFIALSEPYLKWEGEIRLNLNILSTVTDMFSLRFFKIQHHHLHFLSWSVFFCFILLTNIERSVCIRRFPGIYQKTKKIKLMELPHSYTYLWYHLYILHVRRLLLTNRVIEPSS